MINRGCQTSKLCSPKFSVVVGNNQNKRLGNKQWRAQWHYLITEIQWSTWEGMLYYMVNYFEKYFNHIYKIVCASDYKQW